MAVLGGVDASHSRLVSSISGRSDHAVVAATRLGRSWHPSGCPVRVPLASSACSIARVATPLDYRMLSGAMFVCRLGH